MISVRTRVLLTLREHPAGLAREELARRAGVRWAPVTRTVWAGAGLIHDHLAETAVRPVNGVSRVLLRLNAAGAEVAEAMAEIRDHPA